MVNGSRRERVSNKSFEMIIFTSGTKRRRLARRAQHARSITDSKQTGGKKEKQREKLQKGGRPGEEEEEMREEGGRR